MMPESSKYSWAWVTASRQLHLRACELIFAAQYINAVDAAVFTDFFDGENAQGDQITHLPAALLEAKFDPKEPVYCRKGLFVRVTGAISGVFVQWRGLGRKSGG